MKKSQHKLPPRSVLEQRIRREITTDRDEHGQAEFRRGYSLAADDAKNLWNNTVNDLKVENQQLKAELVNQTQAYLTSHPSEITNGPALQYSQQEILPVVEATKHSWIVPSWKTGWLWLSNWAFAAIGYIAVFGLPNEVLALFPEASQNTVIGIVAALGFIFRFINQNKPKPLPPADGDQNV